MLIYSNPPDGFWEHKFTDGRPTDPSAMAIALFDCFRKKRIYSHDGQLHFDKKTLGLNRVVCFV